MENGVTSRIINTEHQPQHNLMSFEAYLAGDLTVFDVTIVVLERIVFSTLADLSQRLEKGCNFISLSIGNGKDWVRVLIHWMRNIHRSLGFGPLAIDKVLYGIRRSGGSKLVGIVRCPRWYKTHAAKGQ
jgi:hypothetical protein